MSETTYATVLPETGSETLFTTLAHPLHAREVLISGLSGNLGQACRQEAERRDWRYTGTLLSRTSIDLSNWQATDHYISTLQGGFDLIIMAHGAQTPMRLKNLSAVLWERVLRDNLTAAASLTTALVKHKRLNPDSLIVYISSLQATQPRAGRVAYTAAKAGLEGLCRAVAVELAPAARTVGLRLGQMTSSMKGVLFKAEELAALRHYAPLPWVQATDVARLIFDLYNQPALTGAIIEISSGHKFSIWPPN